MSRRNYYCLIAGLPDIIQDDKKLHFSTSRIKEYLRDELHPDDFRLAKLFYFPFDNQNLLNRMFRKEKPWDERGNLTEEQANHLILPKLFEESRPEDFPRYLYRFGQLLRTREEVEEEITLEEADRILTCEYFDTLQKAPNQFVRQVASYRMDTGNILLALNGRKHSFQFEEAVTGDNLVARAVRKNQTRDFGLTVDYPDVDQLIQIFETENLLEREFKLDSRQWNFLDDITFFHYFSVERVLAYLLKVFLAERWFHLDYERGQAMFNQLLSDIETSFEFPEEFSNAYGKKR
ncbi:MAG: DUF2764 family protein [Prolixibacteraceae bacterium]|jgi:hypothetical protein|nr:DUF2764 family protein [Bacteroidota bacterium]HOR99760.1 DUF2764 family protein [Prolixibacteraceae bacterium]HOS89650.1 DUF2764 family protein [Prolixibacteraceae bacterium]HPL44652.1 DUF2764 family protein [Prolixibacteraceae bacterium]HQH75790.1 DUF2764 family protein [Prolixibacteraceae bacterium]